jgi:hypothetical protein
MNREPHFVRFAQALALVTGLAGCAATHSGDGDSGRGGDAGGGGDDAAMIADAASATDGGTRADVGTSTDAGELVDADFCGSCDCGFGTVDSGRPTCDSIGHFECCAVVGPLAPPDLAV